MTTTISGKSIKKWTAKKRIKRFCKTDDERGYHGCLACGRSYTYTPVLAPVSFKPFSIIANVTYICPECAETKDYLNTYIDKTLWGWDKLQ